VKQETQLPQSPAYTLRPLNSHTYDLFITITVWCLRLCLVCTSIPQLCSRRNCKKTSGSRWTCIGVTVSNIALPNRWRCGLTSTVL